jgi:hypothetical protein
MHNLHNRIPLSVYVGAVLNQTLNGLPGGLDASDCNYNSKILTNTGTFDKKLGKTQVWNDDMELRNKVIRPQMQVCVTHL